MRLILACLLMPLLLASAPASAQSPLGDDLQRAQAQLAQLRIYYVHRANYAMDRYRTRYCYCYAVSASPVITNHVSVSQHRDWNSAVVARNRASTWASTCQACSAPMATTGTTAPAPRPTPRGGGTGRSGGSGGSGGGLPPPGNSCLYGLC